MNSVLQCLAYLENFDNKGYRNEHVLVLFQLLTTMLNPASDAYENSNRLKEFYRILVNSDDNFEEGKQCDPKYLFIYLQKKLTEENKPGLKLFMWETSLLLHLLLFYFKKLLFLPHKLITLPVT